MKHIFKKLHHHPNRSNETPPPQPSPSSSGGGATLSSGPTTATTNSAESSNRQQVQQNNDYFSSEEEYQVQLALALSVSSDSKAPIRPQQVAANTSAADLLSRRYWNYGIIDFEERVVDGFYDLHSVSADLRDRGDMPSLRDLERNSGMMDYEVVLVNRIIDPALEELMQIASCIKLDCPTAQNSLLIQRLAELVANHLGGPADPNLMLEKWMERRTSLQTNVLPIGSLKTGLLRHRALLFKVLADSVGLPCRLVKGNHFGGTENDAFNAIKLQDDCEWLVDLMGAPGALIPADALSAQDTPSKSSNLKPSATSRNPEALVSSTNSSAIDGGTVEPNDGFSSAKQSVQDLSQASGSSLTQGSNGYIVTGDGVRLNQNVVPYNQKRADDPKNLFADLNPFHQQGSARTAGPNDLSTSVNESHFPKNNNVYGRPPVPLARKNQHEWNVSSFGSRNSNVPSVVSKLPKKSYNNHVVLDEKIPMGSKLAIGEAKTNSQLSPYGREWCSNDAGTYNRDNQDDKLLKKIGSTSKQEHDAHGRDAVNMELRETEGASCTDVSGATYVGAVIDDVGEREILWEDLVIGERIGLGSYGEVYRADWNGTEVAVKKFLDQDFSGAALDEFKREVRIMRRLRHQNVVLFMGAVTRPPNLSIVTEFLPLGSLYRIIHRPNCQIDEKRRIRMALDVARGMNCLHTSIPTIVHRDLKSPNLLVDNNWNVKVCDFGLSRLKHNTFLSSKSTAGTPEWMAPEVLRNEPSNEKCDVYSFGVILWELATLRLPWSGMNPMQVVGAVGFQNRRLDIPKDVDPLVGRIIWECWQMDPNLRPSFAELIEALKPLQCLAAPSHVDQTAQLSSQ